MTTEKPADAAVEFLTVLFARCPRIHLSMDMACLVARCLQVFWPNEPDEIQRGIADRLIVAITALRADATVKN